MNYEIMSGPLARASKGNVLLEKSRERPVGVLAKRQAVREIMYLTAFDPHAE